MSLFCRNACLEKRVLHVQLNIKAGDISINMIRAKQIATNNYCWLLFYKSV